MSSLMDVGINIEYCHYTHKSKMHHSHTHPHYELYFCTENVQQLSIVNGVEYEYKHPCVILSSPYTVHSMSCEDHDSDSYDRFVIYFHKDTLDAFGNEFVPDELRAANLGFLFKLTEKQAEYLRDLLTLISPITQQEKELTLALFFNKLLTFCPLKNAIKIGTSSFYIQDILQYIAETLSEQTNADTIAQKFAISRSKLDRDFKKFTGETFHSFIDNCRLNQSKIYLKKRLDMSIGDIAKSCGFVSDAYFFSYFKKHTGMTPSEYRKSINGIE